MGSRIGWGSTIVASSVLITIGVWKLWAWVVPDESAGWLLGIVAIISLSVFLMGKPSIDIAAGEIDKNVACVMRQTVQETEISLRTLRSDAFTGIRQHGQELTKSLADKAVHIEEVLAKAEERIESFEKLASALSLAQEGTLIDTKTLAEIEAGMEKGKIWVLTHFLDTEDLPEFREAIVANLKEQVGYVYLIPSDKEEAFKNLRKRWVEECLSDRECGLTKEELENNIEYYVIPGHMAYMTVVIYDADEEIPRDVVVKFPFRSQTPEEYQNLMFRIAGSGNGKSNSESEVSRIRKALWELVDSGRKGYSEEEKPFCHCNRVFTDNRGRYSRESRDA